MVWYGMVCKVWYGLVGYGMVWYGMVWYGAVQCGVVWSGVVWVVCCGVVWLRFAEDDFHEFQVHQQKHPLGR